jgi:hypothetical protein
MVANLQPSLNIGLRRGGRRSSIGKFKLIEMFIRWRMQFYVYLVQERMSTTNAVMRLQSSIRKQSLQLSKSVPIAMH